MINSVEDLKNRTLVESNTLKSFILTHQYGFQSPDRDDILIHDYQIANSVTLNSILSNYIVNLKQAWALYWNTQDQTGDSYFRIMEDLEEHQGTLDQDTKLILHVQDGDGSFKSRSLQFYSNEIEVDPGTYKFINLDAVWYGIAKNENGYDTIGLIKGMNNFFVNPNPFGGDDTNAFNDFPVTLYVNGAVSEPPYDSFNKMVESKNTGVNCIVENLFYRNVIDVTVANGEYDPTMFGQIIPECRYLVCLSHRLYGMQFIKGGEKGYTLHVHDIGSLIPNIDKQAYGGNEFDFVSCGFHTVADVTTMFVVFQNTSEDGNGKSHYVYFNQDSYDQTYGFTPVKQVVVDSMVVDNDDVFHKVDSIKSLDTVTIALTDYGFWDIEPNQTNSVTYSYRRTNAGVKNYNITNGTGYNALRDKVLRPNVSFAKEPYAGVFPDKAIEYDKIWKWREDGTDPKKRYMCYHDSTVPIKDSENNTLKYWSQIAGATGVLQDFMGGTPEFAVYNSTESATEDNGRSPMYIVAQMTQQQFNEILFSQPGLVSPLIRWLYDRVVHSNLNSLDNSYGEYYLMNNHGTFVNSLYGILNPDKYSGNDVRTFRDLWHSIENNSTIASYFGSVHNIVKNESSTASTLNDYCTALNTLVASSTTKNLGWVFSDSTEAAAKTTLDGLMTNDFKKPDGYYENQLNALVKEVVQQFVNVEGNSLLSYFTSYLEHHMAEDMKAIHFNNTFCQKDETVIAKVVRDVQNFIKEHVSTALVLGGYKNSGPVDNSRYEGIDSYLHKSRITIPRSKISDIMSKTNAIKEMTWGIQSMPFFSTYTTYDDLNAQQTNGNLFKIYTNVDFAKLSGMFNASNVFNVNWNTVKNWVFNATNVNQENLLKAFIRTQFYRPLFFNHTKYDIFTEKKEVYWCKTDKFYVNHLGETKPLIFTSSSLNADGTFAETVTVDKTKSNLLDVSGQYTIPSAEISYLKLQNVLEYSIHYADIQLVEGKFVLDDVEFYAVIPDTTTGVVNHLYFNQFQQQTQSENDWITVSGNKFTIKGIQYTIEGQQVSVDPATTVFSGDMKEWKFPIVDDMFEIQGVRYALQKSGGNYTRITYADVDDNKLIEIPVGTNGVGEYNNLKFQFSADWKKVKVIKKIQAVVIDRIRDEWCAFDSISTPFDDADANKTFEWYLGNEIVRIKNTYGKTAQMQFLGNGFLYDGFLDKIDCTLTIVNEVNMGHVVSRGVLVKHDTTGQNSDVSQDIGVIFDDQLGLDADRAFRGNLTNNLAVPSASGDKMFILKGNEAKNNVNAVWMNYSTWTGIYQTNEVGRVDEEDETFELNITLNSSVSNRPEQFILVPIEEKNEITGKSEIVAYTVNTRFDGAGQYQVIRDGDVVHVVVLGQRYKIDLRTDKVYLLAFRNPKVSTIDFSTTYGHSTLKENLLTNLKQYMMNHFVQKVMDNPYGAYSYSTDFTSQNDGSAKSGSITVSTDGSVINKNKLTMCPRYIGKYVDLFAGSQQVDGFSMSRQYDLGSAQVAKFSEVYAGNGYEIDDSKMHLGNVYGHILSNISNAFKDSAGVEKNTLLIVEEPSIVVTRVDGKDRFTYTVYFDMYLNTSKNLLTKISSTNPSSFDGKYIIGNAVVRDVKCEVQFTPDYNHGRTDKTMMYYVKYTASGTKTGGKCEVDYDKIIYRDGKEIKSTTIEKKTTTIAVSASYEQSTPTQPYELSGMVSELVSSNLQNIFPAGKIKDMFVGANNALTSTTGPDVQVGYNLTKHRWELKGSHPSSIFDSRGKLYVDGIQYEVNSSDSGATEVGGSRRLTFSSVEDKDKSSVLVAMGGVLLGQISSKFTKTDRLHDQMGLVFNDSKFASVSTADVLTNVNYSNVIGASSAYKRYTGDENLNPSGTFSLIGHQINFYDEDSEAEVGSKEVTFGSDFVEDSDAEFQYDFSYTGDAPNPLVPQTDINLLASVQGWEGLSATMAVTLTDSESDPTVTVSGPLWKFSPLFNGGGAYNFTTIGTRYDFAGVTDVEIQKEEETDESGTTTVSGFLIFKLRFRKTQYDLFIKGSPWVSNGYYWNGSTIRHALMVEDVNGNKIGGSCNAGYVNYPTNMATAANYDELAYYRRMYVNLSDSDLAGIYSPGKIRVLDPDAVREKAGDIYDRYYMTETRKMVAHVNITSTVDNTDAWMDKTNTAKTIGTKYTSNKWKNLIYIPTALTSYDQAIPLTMRQNVENEIAVRQRLDETYFNTTLSRLQGFLQQIDDELNQTLTIDEIRSLCNFKYNMHVQYTKHSTDNSKWKTEASTIGASGMFGYDHDGTIYQDCKNGFNDHLFSEFSKDYQVLIRQTFNLNDRDYHHICLVSNTWESRPFTFNTKDAIYDFRDYVLEKLGENLDKPKENDDLIDQIYGDGNASTIDSNDTLVRYMNAIRTNVFGDVVGVYVADDVCHVFELIEGEVRWYTFSATKSFMDSLLTYKRDGKGEYVFNPTMKQMEFKISPGNEWKLRFANRDLSETAKSEIRDAYMVPFLSDGHMMWFLSSIECYLYTDPSIKIVDVAYEQYGDSVYVMFSDRNESGEYIPDHYLYRYDHLAERKDSRNRVLLKKEVADMKVETFHSVYISNEAKTFKYDYIYIDYEDPQEGQSRKTWKVKLYGMNGGKVCVEEWSGSPGNHHLDFQMYNSVMFGDSLFDDSQLKFQNVSRHKEMFDIIDVNDVDGCYYGLFKNEAEDEDGKTMREKYGHDIYTVFRTAQKYEDDNGVIRTGVVQRLPYRIVVPSMYRTSDDLYALYVVEERDDGRLQLREISVPDNDLYVDRTIDIYGILQNQLQLEKPSDFGISHMIMTEFKPRDSRTAFFVLASTPDKTPFMKVSYEDQFKQVSIDTLEDLKSAMADSLRYYVIGKHLYDLHYSEDYFINIARKINQFADDFTVFDLIPTEFTETQDIGVIPDQKVDDTDTSFDHRSDSVQVSTDVLWTEGMFADSTTNPGMVTAAVSNPATIYDSDYVFLKSQRNPSIEGSEFYDYITDTDGNVLMDLYAIPFIYRVNTNNTYDLYINVPTTRTKYINRIAGTLKDDGTTQVLKDDTRTRLNFLDEALPNNLDESTTRLRIYIDRKYISVGNVELVEISGNSIPLQIYRDDVNYNLYDSIALESRWDGEVNEINEPKKDINKVMLEFECYGTDSQSIYIQGKTLINRSLDDNKYVFG